MSRFERRIQNHRMQVEEKRVESEALAKKLKAQSDEQSKRKDELKALIEEKFKIHPKYKALVEVISNQELHEAGRAIWEVWSPTERREKLSMFGKKIINVPEEYEPRISKPKILVKNALAIRDIDTFVEESFAFDPHKPALLKSYPAIFTLDAPGRTFEVRAYFTNNDEIEISAQFGEHTNSGEFNNTNREIETFSDSESLLDRLAYRIAVGNIQCKVTHTHTTPSR